MCRGGASHAECDRLVFSELTRLGVCPAGKGDSPLPVPGAQSLSPDKDLLHLALRGDTTNRDADPVLEGLRHFQRDHARHGCDQQSSSCRGARKTTLADDALGRLPGGGGHKRIFFSISCFFLYLMGQVAAEVSSLKAQCPESYSVGTRTSWRGETLVLSGVRNSLMFKHRCAHRM